MPSSRPPSHSIAVSTSGRAARATAASPSSPAPRTPSRPPWRSSERSPPRPGRLPRPIRVRIGVHTGEAELREGDYYGSAVNRCARLRGIGHGGQVLLSEATTALVRDDLPAGAALLDLGAHRLKDLTRPERVFQLVAPDLPAEFPALVSLDARPHNLPLQTTPLLGREQEVQAVSAVCCSATTSAS